MLATPSRRTPTARATGAKRRAGTRKKKTTTPRASKTLRKPGRAFAKVRKPSVPAVRVSCKHT